MRFAVFVKATEDSEAGIMPTPDQLAEMDKYNEEMVKAGIVVAGEGLQPSSKGARIRWSGGKRTVIDGPFTETKELVAGFGIIQVKSKEEAIEWASRAPFGDGSEVEIRQVFEAADFDDAPAPEVVAGKQQNGKRKIVSFLFISLDGVVEAPDKFLRADLYQDLDPIMGAAIAEQDAVLLGRRQYEEWSTFWPQSTIEPFATFINNTPKYVVSKTLRSVDWNQSNLISENLEDAVAALKAAPGRTIGVGGSISLVQSLLTLGLLDELRLVLIPALAGQGRRLFSREGDPIQMTLHSTQKTPNGLQYMVFHPSN